MKITDDALADELGLWDLDAEEPAKAEEEKSSKKDDAPDLPKAEIPDKPRTRVNQIGGAAEQSSKYSSRKADPPEPKESVTGNTIPTSRDEGGSRRRMVSNTISPKQTSEKPFVANRKTTDEELEKLPKQEADLDAESTDEAGKDSLAKLPVIPDLDDLDIADAADDLEVAAAPTPKAESKPVANEEKVGAVATEKEAEEPTPAAAAATNDAAPVSEATDDEANIISFSPLAFFRKENVGIIAVIAVTLITAAFGVVKTFSELPTADGAPVSPDTPITGQHITIEDYETYWRPPVLEGENADRVSASNLYLPILRFTLGEDSNEGFVRILFVEESKEIAASDNEGNGIIYQGDTQSTTVAPGSRYRVVGSKGFTEHGQLYAYRRDDANYWFAVILEAPSANAPSEEFREIARIPIAPDVYDEPRED